MLLSKRMADFVPLDEEPAPAEPAANDGADADVMTVQSSDAAEQAQELEPAHGRTYPKN